MNLAGPERAAFHQFLAEAAEGNVRVEDWNRFVVTRYADAELEVARKRLAQAALFDGQCSARPINDRVSALAAELLLQFESA